MRTDPKWCRCPILPHNSPALLQHYSRRSSLHKGYCYCWHILASQGALKDCLQCLLTPLISVIQENQENTWKFFITARVLSYINKRLWHISVMSTVTELQNGTVETLRYLSSLNELGSSLEMELFLLFLRRRNQSGKSSSVSLFHLPLLQLSPKLPSLLQCIDLISTEFVWLGFLLSRKHRHILTLHLKPLTEFLHKCFTYRWQQINS